MKTLKITLGILIALALLPFAVRTVADGIAGLRAGLHKAKTGMTQEAETSLNEAAKAYWDATERMEREELAKLGPGATCESVKAELDALDTAKRSRWASLSPEEKAERRLDVSRRFDSSTSEMERSAAWQDGRAMAETLSEEERERQIKLIPASVACEQNSIYKRLRNLASR